MKQILVLLAIVGVSACAGPVQAPSRPLASQQPLAPGELALPTDRPVALPPGAVEACGGVGINAVLHGNAADPRVTWLVNSLGGRVDVTWPPGYRARFTPSLEVLNADDVVVLREGAPVSGACVTSQSDVLHLEPPFR
ncbi:MAG: hypothetical protein HY262_08910 [Chloroflexi bacterium]|nr:hypothetical protein [Chloroflexota bacterium]